MQLTDTEKAYLSGEAGQGVQKCMQVLVNFAKAFGATKLVKISSAHVIPNIPLGLLEELTQGVDALPVMTTLHPHMSVFCPSSWKSMGINAQYANSILVKPNQIGTLSEILNIVESAKKADYGIVISRRSGETEDTSISDLAVALNCPKVKFGSFARTESMAKYNQLLRLKHAIAKSNELPYEISKVV